MSELKNTNNNPSTNTDDKKKKNKANIRIIGSVAGVLIICCLAYFGISLYNAHTKDEFNKSVKSEVSSTASVVSLPVVSKAETESEVELVDNPIDFKKLSENNSDLYAWLEVPGTNVDYPVAQSNEDEEDDFYLHRGVNKEYYFAGTVYSQKRNSRDFSDRHTVLYGHNMLDGSMFATLHNFADEDFFKEHKYMYVYIPGHILKYEIFAAYEYDDRHLLNSFNCSDDDVWEDYVEIVNNPSSPYTCNTRGKTVSVKDKILTLSTCTAYRSSDRYLVQGVLVDDTLTK